MGRTALACALLVLTAWLASAWATHDYQVWTAEGARRLEVALQPVEAPAVTVQGPGFDAQTLPQLLSSGQSVTIVDFIYTRCRTVCSVLGSQFQQLQAAIRADPAAARERGGVRLLSISFDARDDTPTLRAYADGLRAEPSIWRFVQVPDATQRRRLLEQFQVVVIPDGPGEFEHNAALLVVDAQARLVRIFNYDELDQAWLYARSLQATGGAG